MSIRWTQKMVFLSILVGMIVFMNAWMDRGGNQQSRLQFEEAFHPKVNADMIIIGASHAGHGINPKYLERDGLKVFNFGTDGAGPYYFLKWYRKIFQRYYRKPETVIFGVHWVMFESHILQRQLEQDSSYFPRHFLFEELHNFKEMKTLVLNQFAFIRERKKLPYRLVRIFEKERKKGPHIIAQYYNGFVPYERRGRLDKKKGSKPKNDILQINAFKELLDEFEKNHIRVILVSIPGYLPARDADNIRESIELIHTIAKEKNIPFLDYEMKRITDLNTDPSLFSDWVHLNGKGSDAFSKLLKSDLDLLLDSKKTRGGAPPT
ncbi:MAG: hypothetical protein HXY44_14960 [Syntrophaceae bacterium]|nr:hypothetical protein [Syntrophaceae bacterium]